MLIGIAGRKGSGKSTIARLLLDRKFQKVSFADPLKKYVSQLFNWELASLYTQEGKEAVLDNPVEWNADNCKKLSDIAEVEIPYIENKFFNTKRDVLQYIGTEVFRKQIDEDFHVNKFKEVFTDGDFVCDDMRFPNELKTVKEMNGIPIYLLRPNYWDYSNHSSEISLNRNEFDYIFINNTSEKRMINKFGSFLDNLFSKKKRAPFTRDKFLNVFNECNYDTEIMADRLNCSRDKIVWWARKYMVYINRNSCDLDENAFRNIDLTTAYWAGVLSADGSIKKHLKYDYLLELTNTDKSLVDGFKLFLKTNKNIYSIIPKNRKKRKYYLTVSSPYLIEDLKLWNIEPLKSRINKIPDVAKNNDELLSSWLVGLIDGDGSIYYADDGNNVGITILASEQIIDYLQEWLKIPACKTQEKKIENLYNLKFSGKNSVALYKKIYRGIGLERKWSKVKKFENKIWHH